MIALCPKVISRSAVLVGGSTIFSIQKCHISMAVQSIGKALKIALFNG
jgi:hypothetical protein